MKRPLPDPAAALEAMREFNTDAIKHNLESLERAEKQRDYIMAAASKGPVPTLAANPKSRFLFPERLAGEMDHSNFIDKMLRAGVGSFYECHEWLEEDRRAFLKKRKSDVAEYQKDLAASRANEDYICTRIADEARASGKAPRKLVWEKQRDLENYIGNELVRIRLMEEDKDFPSIPVVNVAWSQLQWKRYGQPVYVIDQEIADAMVNTRPLEECITELPKLPHPGMYIHIDGVGLQADDEGISPVTGLYVNYDDPEEPTRLLFQTVSRAEDGTEVLTWPTDPKNKEPDEDGVVWSTLEESRLAFIDKGFTFYNPLDDKIHETEASYWWVRRLALFTVNLMTCLNRTMVIKREVKRRQFKKGERKKARKNGVEPIEAYTLLYIDSSARATVQRRPDAKGTPRKGNRQVRHLRPGHFSRYWVKEPGQDDLPDQTKSHDRTGNTLYRVVRWKAPYWAGQKTCPDVPPKLPRRRVKEWRG